MSMMPKNMNCSAVTGQRNVPSRKRKKEDNRHERVSVKEKLAEKKDAVIKMNAGKEHSAPEKKKEAVI